MSAVLEGHRDALRCAAWSPAGVDVVTAGDDGVALIHPAPFDALLARAGALLNRRSMTEEEWLRYMGHEVPLRPSWPPPAPGRR
jgi:hypothetical protein